MDERATWLNEQIAKQRELFLTGIKHQHQATMDTAPLVAFAQGLGGGIALSLVDMQQEIAYLHRPDERSECTSCGRGGVVENDPWPCPTVDAVARAYRHAAGFDEAWSR